MAEAIALAASIIAVVQLADRVAGVCKSLIETVQDYPRDLRLIFVETGSLKVIFESLHFLDEDDPADSATLQRLRGPNGPVEGCKAAMDQLDQLFPKFPPPGSKHKGFKKQKLQTMLTSLAWPLKADKARKLLSEIMCHKSTINVALQGQLLTEFRSVKHKVDEVYVTLNASEKRKVYQWYQDTNPSSSHNIAKGLYEDKTGDWVFRTSEWDDWMNARIRALWIHGIPGAGKTILAAHIIEKTLRICEAKNRRKACVYYYCYHGHNQDESVPLLRWLVSELLREADTVPTLAWKAYSKSREPDTTLLLDILHTILDIFDLVYVAIDALDESQPRQNLLTVLNILATDFRFQNVQLLATSREYSDIQLMMGRFSQPLSMSNRFVEEDIRVYVTAKILGEAKFQRWRPDLRAEVEEALATGAKGMFRWAVCQLDTLRRLNSSSKIRRAIKSLPKTMDETYERIFSSITDEEKELVRHTLHWVCLHDLLWKGKVPLPAKLLIDAYIAQDRMTNQLSSDECLHDLETLKDSCGCLVSFTFDEEHQSQLASVAHYTVREFLESDRSSLTSWFSIKRNDSYGFIASFIMEYSITSGPNEILEGMEDYFQWDLGSNSTLQEYCLATSVRSMQELEEAIEPRLAIRILSPLEAHSETFYDALYTLDYSSEIRAFGNSLIQPWDIIWCNYIENWRIVILVNLLMMKCFNLAKEFIRDLDIESFLQENLCGSIKPSLTWNDQSNSIDFECNIVELFAEIRDFGLDVLEFFQKEARGLVCYTNLLPHFMPGHACEPECHSPCPLSRLLQLGANPDPKGFQVSPLQIAVFSRDLAGVRALLEAGADPNNKGDVQGIKFHAGISLLGPYDCLHGLTPLYILQHLKAYPYWEDPMSEEEISHMNGATTTDIERLLLDYDAVTVPME